MPLFWIFFILAGSTILELCLSLSHLALPLTFLACSYTIVLLPLSRSLAACLIAAVFHDLAMGRNIPVSVFLLPIVLLTSWLWGGHGNTRNLYLQMLPGGIAGAAGYLSILLYALLKSLSVGCGFAGWFPLYALTNLFGGLLLMPCLCFLFDHTARLLNLPRYRSANRYERWKRHSADAEDMY